MAAPDPRKELKVNLNEHLSSIGILIDTIQRKRSILQNGQDSHPNQKKYWDDFYDSFIKNIQEDIVLLANWSNDLAKQISKYTEAEYSKEKEADIDALTLETKEEAKDDKK